MTTIAALIWVWSLVILPFTAILTFILTLVICSQVPNNAPRGEKYPQISQLGTGEAYPYFVGGFVFLLPQLLIILLGRIQFLFQTQYIINSGIIFIIHDVYILVFMLSVHLECLVSFHCIVFFIPLSYCICFHIDRILLSTQMLFGQYGLLSAVY
jgi:hypothetical protein